MQYVWLSNNKFMYKKMNLKGTKKQKKNFDTLKWHLCYY